MNNPWVDLPDVSPFELPQDSPIIEKCNHADDHYRVRTDILPAPFVGRIDSSKVVLLNLNPGFVDKNLELPASDPQFVEETRNALTFESDPSFYCLSENFSSTPAYKWWNPRLKALTEEVGRDNVINGIMCIQYFPYHSRGLHKFRELLPSQSYAFHLVREAIASGKVIVVMRLESEWIKHVPELSGYSYIKLKSPRSAYISAGNLASNGFQRIVEALTPA